MKICIINGPNLNFLGKREPYIYGNLSFDDYLSELKNTFPQVEFDYFQSNHEGEIIDKIQETSLKGAPIIINAGAYTHTSIAIADALRLTNAIKIEVHISNIFAREEYRKTSYISEVCTGVITGLGLSGYKFAIEAVIEAVKN